MTANSYFEIREIIKDLILSVDNIKLPNERIIEVGKEMNKILDRYTEEISKIETDELVLNDILNEASTVYINLEQLLSPYCDKCNKTHIERLKVNSLASAFLSTESIILKSNVLLDPTVVPSDSLKNLKKLWEESKSIGFFLDIEDKSIVKIFDDLLKSLGGC